jgi:hypothetical protein
MRQRTQLAILVIAYWLVSLGIYAVWERHGWYPPTGDEPHHIIIGRAIVDHGSLEQTQAYEEEFARRGRPGETITRANAHIVETRRGRFSFHSPGTGIVAALPIGAAALLGYEEEEIVVFVKVFFVLLSGIAVAATWVFAYLYMRSTPARVIAVLLTCFSLPLVIAANQVFPDLLAGVLGLSVLAWLAWISKRQTIPLWQGVAATCFVASLPWLHYKLAVMAAVIGLAVLYVCVRNDASWKRPLILCLAPAVAGAAFFLYNYYAFGSPVYLDSRITVHGDAHAVMWFLALHLDRWHGFFLQNPVFFIGLIFLVPFVIRQPFVGTTALLAYLAVTGINAAHGSPGYSFAGRHAWTGCMLMIPATLYGLGCLESLSRRAFFVTSGALMLLQAGLIVPLVITRHDLYNPNFILWFDVYPSFLPDAMARFLPAFYDVNWWYRYPANYVFVFIAASLIGIGAWSYPRRRDKTLPLTGGLLLMAIPITLLTGVVQPKPPRRPLVFAARSLHRHFGIVQQDAVVASVEAHDAGIWSFGPYIRLGKGRYRVSFRIESQAPEEIKVGSWDVTARAGEVRLAMGNIMGTAGKLGDVSGIFEVSLPADGEAVETRLFFDDVADLTFADVSIEPIDH